MLLRRYRSRADMQPFYHDLHPLCTREPIASKLNSGCGRLRTVRFSERVSWSQNSDEILILQCSSRIHGVWRGIRRLKLCQNVAKPRLWALPANDGVVCIKLTSRLGASVYKIRLHKETMNFQELQSWCVYTILNRPVCWWYLPMDGSLFFSPVECFCF